MNHLDVNYFDINDPQFSLQDCALLLRGHQKHLLSFVNWKEFPYQPHGNFTIAHSNLGILLQFDIEEKFVRAVNTQTNANIWEDSCVEFFIQFDETGYYNLEMNAIGAALAGFGADKPTRKRLPNDVIEKIKISTNGKETEEGWHWELTALIPFDFFMHHQFQSLKGKSARANFYKCGDLLPDPHFISWNKIESPKPNFHLPDFFGHIQFE